jgi:hypothetical protein
MDGGLIAQPNLKPENEFSGGLGHKLTVCGTGEVAQGNSLCNRPGIGRRGGKIFFIIDKTGKEGYDLQCISFLDQEGHI